MLKRRPCQRKGAEQHYTEGKGAGGTEGLRDGDREKERESASIPTLGPTTDSCEGDQLHQESYYQVDIKTGFP